MKSLLPLPLMFIIISFILINRSTGWVISCDFEGVDPLCSKVFTIAKPGWNHILAQWQRGSGSTPTPNTGPSSGHGGSGHYLYIESSNIKRMDAAAFYTTSPLPQVGPSGAICMKFYYHTYGSDIGQLNVHTGISLNAFQRVFSTPFPPFHAVNNTNWQLAQVSVPNKDRYILFEAFDGNGEYGDIAIDDITITDEGCPKNEPASGDEPKTSSGDESETQSSEDESESQSSEDESVKPPSADESLNSTEQCPDYTLSKCIYKCLKEFPCQQNSVTTSSTDKKLKEDKPEENM